MFAFSLAALIPALVALSPVVQAQSITDSVPPPTQTSDRVQEVLAARSDALSAEVFVYKDANWKTFSSEVYTHPDFVKGLKVMYERGVAGKYFYLGDESSHVYGLVNIAAFLAQSMKESIQYNACDENSWDLVSGRYPISNACGQLNQSYQDYKCSAGQEHMECEVDPEMTITATTNAKWYGAPGPLYCGPKSLYPFTGYWDYNLECNKPWADPPEFCQDYEGQKAGGEVALEPVANSAGRTDVEGCCWWGRGAIQSTGVCNYGRLNYFLGERAANEGRPSAYPDVNFCKTPDAICSSEKYPDLKWVAGLFYWIDSVQGYEVDGWKYLDEVHKFVDGGMWDENFINGVSGIVNRGCHNPPCATGPLDGGPERAQNFRTVLSILLEDPAPVAPVSAPTNAPVAPTNAPVPAPTNAPVPAPTNAPVSEPTNAPVPAPTNAPVSEPTNSSVSEPTNAPVPAPTNAPVSEPTNASVSEPTNAPVPAPTNAPVSEPTNAPVPAPTNSPVESPITAPTQAPVSAPTTPVAPSQPGDDIGFPIESPIRMCCQPGETGLKPVNGCRSFYSCTNGVLAVSRSSGETPCPDGLLFHNSKLVCDWPEQVQTCEIDPCIDPTELDNSTNDTPVVPEGNTTDAKGNLTSSSSGLTRAFRVSALLLIASILPL